MIDMKLSHEKSSDLLGVGGDNNGPQYPHGLTLTLDTETLKKLAMSLPQVGDLFTLDALAEVISVSKDQGQISDARTVTLQITALGLENPEDEMNEQQQAYDRVQRMF